MKKILIIGWAHDKHIYRFISHLKKEDNSLIIDVLSYSNENRKLECAAFCEKIYFPQESMQWLSSIKYIGQILKAIKFKHCLKKLISQQQHYDAIFVLWILPQNIFAASSFKKLSKNIILVPLGSDVLRISKLAKFALKGLYQKADYIILPQTGFRKIVQQDFKVKEPKIVNLGFGSNMIDTIKESTLTKEDAKRELNITDKFVITIGYNASEAQNHLAVIHEINTIRQELPHNLLLVLPMSYPTTQAHITYKKEIRRYLQSQKYDFIILENYLNDEDLLLYRKCSDIFIHAQRTDASCSSIQEYLLANCTVLNADWLQYPQLEKYGKPYFTFSSINEIGKCILEAIKTPQKFYPNQKLIREMYNRGWKHEIKQWISFINSIK